MEYSGLISMIYPPENLETKFILTNIWSKNNYGVIEDKMLVIIPSNVIPNLKVNTCITIKGEFQHYSNKLPTLFIPNKNTIKPKSNSSDTSINPTVSYFIRYSNTIYTF